MKREEGGTEWEEQQLCGGVVERQQGIIVTWLCTNYQGRRETILSDP